MGLADVALRQMLTVPFDLALWSKGSEVVNAGYRRQTPESWVVDGTRAWADVTFGPFVGDVRADAVVLMSQGQPVRTIPFDSEARVPDGAKLAYRANVRFVDG
jgi:hypothetical protein